MSYSRETLSAFSAALGTLYAAEAPGTPSPIDIKFPPHDGPLNDDDAFLAELFASHVAARQRAPALTSPAAVKARRAAQEAAEFFRLCALGLTPRECEVLFWIAQGRRDAEIARELDCAPKTVSKHVENVLAKLGVETRLAAVRAAQEWLQQNG